MKESRSTFKEFWKSLSEKLKESLVSVMPVSLLVFILALTPWVDISVSELVTFVIAAVLLVLGIGLFNSLYYGLRSKVKLIPQYENWNRILILRNLCM